MGQLRCGILFACLTSAILQSTKSETQVYRFAGKDVFKNPEYSSYTECGVMTCARYQAKCLEDGNCCLCRCKSGFSTFNVSEAKCVSDESILQASVFRLIRDKDQLQTKMPIISLTKPKTLGKIISMVKGNSPLKKCKVVSTGSYYWTDSLRGDWKPVLQTSKKLLFGIRTTKKDVSLQWIYTNSTSNSWFHGRVFRLGIQCAGMTSTIIFKSRNDYNENDFVGCLNPDIETNSPSPTFTCATMTAKLCKDFCRGRGHSVAMLKQGNQCSCTEYTQVMSWSEIKFSCSIPCSKEEGKFCGGKETYSVYRTMPEWPHDFKFSSNGTINSSEYRCMEITHQNSWSSSNSTYFCARKRGTNIKLSWYSEEPREKILAKRRCISTNQTSNSTSSKKNFLCVLKEAGLRFIWSTSGQVLGTECLQIKAEVSVGWKDIYLCAVRPKENKTMVSMLCPNKPVQPMYDSTMDPQSTRTSRTRETYRYTHNVLPHTSELPPSQLTVSNSGSKPGPKKRDKDHKYKDLTPVYIFVPLACILSILMVGIFVFLYLKKKMKSKQQVGITNFDNLAWQKDKKTRNGQIDQTPGTYSSRKSRKERLPSLPAETYPLQTPRNPLESLNIPPTIQVTPPGSQHTPNETQNARQVLTLEAAKERSKTLEIEIDVYTNRRPTASNDNTNHAYELDDRRNSNSVNIRRYSLANPTYETIDNFFKPDTIYLEVLP